LRHESRLTAHSGSDIKNAMGSSEDPDEAMATGLLPRQWRAAGVLSCPSRRSSPAGRREGGSEPNATHKATGGWVRGGWGVVLPFQRLRFGIVLVSAPRLGSTTNNM
jgi:hypothetical protein